jgi:hypothetical protein
MGSLLLTHCSNSFQVQNMFISRFMIQILHNFQNVKASEKMSLIKPTYQYLAAFVFVHSVPTAEF